MSILRQNSKKMRQAKQITAYLKANKKLFTGEQLLDVLDIKKRSWVEALIVGKTSGWIGTFGNKKGQVYCHADYSEDLKSEYAKLVEERETAYKNSRSDYFKGWWENKNAAITEKLEESSDWSAFNSRRISG